MGTPWVYGDTGTGEHGDTWTWVHHMDTGKPWGHGDTMGTWGQCRDMGTWGHHGNMGTPWEHGDSVGTWGHCGDTGTPYGHGDIGTPWGHVDTMETWGHHGYMGTPWGHGDTMGTRGHHGDSVGTEPSHGFGVVLGDQHQNAAPELGDPVLVPKGRRDPMSPPRCPCGDAGGGPGWWGSGRGVGTDWARLGRIGVGSWGLARMNGPAGCWEPGCNWCWGHW